MKAFMLAAMMMAPMAQASGAFPVDLIFIGEVHDNPAHHARQAEIVAAVQPAAVVWEMLTPEQAALVTPDLRGAALGEALDWAESGWPDFAMYAPIFDAAGNARHLGAAVPRAQARAVIEQPLAEVFGTDTARFGLDQPLPEAQQTAREALQMAAHCDALPVEMLPMMVDIQRLRDAALARAALDALARTGGPVAVITGNGHARKDWGVPAVLALAAPDVSVYVIGQAEAEVSAMHGLFDAELLADPVDRGDPCDAFR